MIVKVKFEEKPYFSHVFLVGVSNYRERFVVFNDKTEKFELIYSTKDKDCSTRYVYTFDYTYEGFVEKELIELEDSIIERCKGYPWLINDIELVKAIEKGEPVPRKYIEFAKDIHQNMNPYGWHKVKDQKDLSDLEYISGCFHDCYLKGFKGTFNNPCHLNDNTKNIFFRLIVDFTPRQFNYVSYAFKLCRYGASYIIANKKSIICSICFSKYNI